MNADAADCRRWCLSSILRAHFIAMRSRWLDSDCMIHVHFMLDTAPPSTRTNRDLQIISSSICWVRIMIMSLLGLYLPEPEPWKYWYWYLPRNFKKKTLGSLLGSRTSATQHLFEKPIQVHPCYVMLGSDNALALDKSGQVSIPLPTSP